MGSGIKGHFTVTDALRSREMQSEMRRGRIEDYLFLKNLGLTKTQIMERMNLSRRTLDRYRSEVNRACERGCWDGG